MDEKVTPDGATQKASTGEAAESATPGTAPAVPTDILRQLTNARATTGHKKQITVDDKDMSPETAPALPLPESTAPKDDAEQTSTTTSEASEGDKSEQLDDGMSDPETDQAVDDIVAKEGDEILAVQDAETEEAAKKPLSFGQKFKLFFYNWWHNKWARWGTIVALLVVIATVAAVPVARYAVLNLCGVRASVSVVALDSSTDQPLKNVTVSIGDQQAETNIEGVAKVQHIKLGSGNLTIKRLAFKTVNQHVVVGWGSNPLGTFNLQPTGVQYTINVTDYLTGKPLPNVEANSNGIEALSDKKGKIVLTVDNKDAQAVPVAIILSGYRTEQLNIAAATTAPTAVQLVPARQDVFISNQSGKYDLYKIDVDGKNKQLLLAGTGTESSNISLVVSPAGDEAALISTRDNMRDSDGYLLTTLTLINIADGSTVTLDHAEQIQIVDWIDNRLVYQVAMAGASAANPQRYRLVSYDYTTNSRAQLATANQFNSVLTANGIIYYAIAATDPSMPSSFNKIRPDGSAHQTIYSQEVWSVFRTDYNTFTLQTPAGWYAYSIQNNQLSKAGAPSSFVSRVYDDASNGQQSLWVDTRDGEGALLAYNLASSKDTTLQTQDGLTYPVRWLNSSTVIYGVVTKSETADYVLSLNGGQPHKITDVTHTYGITQGN